MEWIAIAAGVTAVAVIVAFLLGHNLGRQTAVMAHRLANHQDPLNDPEPIEGKLERTG